MAVTLPASDIWILRTGLTSHSQFPIISCVKPYIYNGLGYSGLLFSMDLFLGPSLHSGFIRMALTTLTDVVCIIALQYTFWKFGINMTKSGKTGSTASRTAPISMDIRASVPEWVYRPCSLHLQNLHQFGEI